MPFVKIFVFIDKNLTAQGEKDIVESTEVYPLQERGCFAIAGNKGGFQPHV